MAKYSFFVCVVCFAVVTAEVLDHRFFLGQIIKKYGHNGTISYEGFERLYTNLGLGSPDSTSDDQNLSLSRPDRDVSKFNSSQTHEELERLVVQHEEVFEPVNIPDPQHCLSPRDLLVVYGLAHAGNVSLSPVSFLHLCPAIVYELDVRSCASSHQSDRIAHSHSHSHSHSHASTIGGATRASWLFASLTIILISISGLLCVAVVPLLQKSFISQLISFLVALAVGTLLGDAFLHLVPHALESHSHEGHTSHTDSILKTGLMFLTVVFFFTFESVLNVRKNSEEDNRVQEKVTYVPMSSVKVNDNEKEMMMENGTQHTHSHHSHSDNNIALMVVMGDGLHNLTDGLAIGAAFSGGLAPGFATAVAVFTHELPHELGDFAVLIQAGMTVRKALFYNLVSSVLSFLGTAVGLIIGNFGDSTRWIYAITAGSFIYIALSNLVPEINRQKASYWTILLRLSGILCGGGLMGCIALYEEDIHQMFL
ncbi:zinc transporter ZIP10 isoform X2 [Homalodisca vitripennis]|uniref:zinc transporter ZIP10 isoform X2 n=1 Tax=Homalodisca vitripennis TaxID=197043 RepID=UPI001EECB874|nr:zinc transporter ZIP10 isoform X2 [Homalodisca vitripennis]